MNDKKKSIIYFSIIILLAISFVALYLLDSNISKSEGTDAFTGVIKALEPAVANVQEDDSKNEESSSNLAPKDDQSFVISDRVQVINWDKSQIDSIRVSSPRNKFTLTNHGPRRWAIKSIRVDQKIVKTNRALFKLLNIFEHFYTDNNLTKDYSEYAEQFEKPHCTVTAHFKNGTTRKMTFIRIEEYDDFSQKVITKNWTRVNEETVVYATTYNILERFLVSEKEFLKFY